jgi:hypothetical protein
MGRHAQALPARARAYAPPQSPYPRLAVHRPARVQSASNLTSSGTPAASAGSLSRRSVCVRLCDGFAFPVADYSGPGDDVSHSAVCAGMCPGAPTRLYVAAAGDEKLDTAISTRDQKPYSALPVAFRYATTKDATCGCHAPGASVLANVSVLKDLTLRPGDKVMTQKGFRVFQGAAKWPYKRENFSTLAKAGLDKGQMYTLRAMERVSRLASVQVTPAAPTGLATPIPSSRPPASGYKALRVIGPKIYISQIEDVTRATP